MKTYLISVVSLVATALFLVSTSVGATGASKAGVTPQDQLFSAYVDAVAEYGKSHTPEGDGRAEYVKGVTPYLEDRLATFKTMPEYYETLALGLPDSLKPDPDNIAQAVKLAPDDWQVAYLQAFAQHEGEGSDSKQWLSDLKGLAIRFPDKSFIHYQYSAAALRDGDNETAWRELRLGNAAADLTWPTLFPHRYLLAKFQEGAPPELPWTARMIDGGTSLGSQRFSVLMEMKSFAKQWATMKDSPGTPNANEMRAFACRFGTMEPMSLICTLATGAILSVIDRATGYDDLTALNGRLEKPAGSEKSDAGRGARRYLETRREIVAYVRSFAFTADFLVNPYQRYPKREDKPDQHKLQHLWELNKGGYFEWALCQDLIRPLLEKLATFDYDNPAVFAPKEDAPKDKAAK